MVRTQTRRYYVYMITNGKRTLYVGMTNDLERRIYEHKYKLVDGFTKKYNITWIVYYEEASTAETAVTREKQIKRWTRQKKVDLIESTNPKWKDMAAGWYS
jgi:putative endonuclease